jgi:hypothetical protein
MIDLGELIVDLTILGVYPPHGGGGSGTVTSIATTGGITGGTITTTGTLSLAAIATNRLLANPTGGTATPVPTTVTALFDSVFGATQGDILYRNGTNWTTLAPSTLGYVLQTGGAGGNPSWVPAGGYTPFAYANTYWVSQTNGNDANLGTSIETPLQTVQQAITLAGTAPARIYVVDANINNNETIVTLATGQTLFIDATGTSFQGSITQSTGDALYIAASYADAIVSNSTSNTYLEGGQFVLTTTAASAVYVNAAQFQGFHTGGTVVFANCNNLNAINIGAGCTVSVDCALASGITNAGTLNIVTNSNPASAITSNTGTINGVMGDVEFGDLGIAPPSSSAANYYLTSAAPTGAGQVLVSNGAGPNASTSWAAQGGYTPFAYANSLWVSMANGNDLNSGTSIETPLLTLQQAAILAAGTPTNIYIVDNGTNTETFASVSGTACNLNIIAPGVTFNGSYLFQNVADVYTIQCYSINNVTDNSNGANNTIIAADNVSGITDNSAGMNISAKAQISSYAYTGNATPGLVSLNGNFLVSIVFNPVTNVTASISAVHLALFNSTAGSTDSTYYIEAVYSTSFSQTGADSFYCQVGEGNPTISGGTFYGNFGGDIYANAVAGLGVGYQNIINYLLTSNAPTAAGQVLLSTGASAPYGTVWGSSSGYIPTAYAQALWVSQATGNDANSGVSIESPLATVQHAINLISSGAPVIIYVVDANGSNNETINSPGLGYTIFIAAPGTSFNGTITQAAGDLISLNAFYVDAFVTNSTSPAYFTGGTFNLTSTTTGAVNVNCNSYAGAHTGGATVNITAQDVTFLSIDSSITAYVNAPTASNITNGGTLYIFTNSSGALSSNTGNIYGLIGSTVFGPAGIAASTSLYADYYLPVGSPTATGQVPVSTATGAGATTAWAPQGGYTPFAYPDSYWQTVAGSDSNLGTSIETPFASYAHALALAGNTPVGVYGVDINITNSETLNLNDGSSPGIQFFSFGTTFAGTYTQSNNSSLTVKANSMQNLTSSGGGNYTTLDCDQSVYNFNSSDGYNYIQIDTGTIGSSSFGAGDYVTVFAGTASDLTNAANLTAIIGGSVGGGNLTNSGTLNALIGKYAGTITNTGNIYGLLNGVYYGGLGLANSTDNTAQYTLTGTAPTGANQVLLSSGAGPGATTSWGTAGGYTPFAYQYTYWVSGYNGNDSNTGTSIESPFATVQHAINQITTANTMIYVVDSDQNSETLTSPGTVQIFTIFAPGVTFNGSFTNSGDDITIIAKNISNFYASSRNSYLTYHAPGGALNLSGGNTIANALALGGVALSSGATLNVYSVSPISSITNDGTGVILGMSGNTALGIGLNVSDSLGQAIQYNLTNTAPTAANQVLVSSGAGPGATTSWAAQGGVTPHAYTAALWVDDVNGSDSNSGTSIEEPFLTYTKAITVAANTPTIIYGINGNASNGETISTLGTGQEIWLNAPGTTFAGVFTISSGDTVWANVNYIGNLVMTGSSYLYATVNQLNATISGTPILNVNSTGTLVISMTGGTVNAFSGSQTSTFASNDISDTVNLDGSWGTVYLTGTAYITGSVSSLTTTLTGNAFCTGPITGITTNAGVVWVNSPTGSVGTNTGTVQGLLTGVNFGDLALTSITSASATPNYTITSASPTGANQVLVSSGAGPGATTSWAAQTAYTPFAYTHTYWVDPVNGNDSNLGTSIETPFKTVQHAINTASGSTAVIVNYLNPANSETISYSGLLNITINAPGTIFTGAISISGGPNFTLVAGNITNTLTLDIIQSHIALSGNTTGGATGTLTLTTSGSTYCENLGPGFTTINIAVNCNLYYTGNVATLNNNAGGRFYGVASTIGTLNNVSGSVIAHSITSINNTSSLNIMCLNGTVTTNSGTITGMIGDIVFGALAVASATGTAAAYTLPTTDGTAGQKLTTNGAGVVSWV